jgi:hypothetical protein
MTQEEFKEILRDVAPYEIVGDKVIVSHGSFINLAKLESLPSGFVFNNKREVILNSLKSLGSGTEFNNGESVNLRSLESLPNEVKFNNGGIISLDSLKSIPTSIEFRNASGVYLESLVGGWFSEWKGNIEGVGNKGLLNLMIKRGVFI